VQREPHPVHGHQRDEVPDLGTPGEEQKRHRPLARGGQEIGRDDQMLP
jgi:hypothetical protein